MPEFTPDQKSAIYTHGKNILVSAAAGSGKTAVLTERVLTMLCDENSPVDVDRLLVVTFTNAAAAEMKSRIRDKISSTLSSDIPDKLRLHLQKQIPLMGKASITTIDSFCIDIVRNNFHLLDIDPAFRVGENGELAILAEKAAKSVIEEMYSGKDAPFFSEITKWFGDKDSEVIASLIRCYNFLQSFPEPDKQLDFYENMYLTDFSENSEPLWCTYIKDFVKILSKSCIEAANDLLVIINENGLAGYENGAVSALSVLERLENACALPWDEFRTALTEIQFPSIGKKNKNDDPILCETVKNIYDNIKTAFKKSSGSRIANKLGHMDFKTLKTAQEKATPYISMFCDTLRMFDKKYAEMRKDAGIVSFSDFEHMAYDILKDSSNGVADGYREKFAEIFVDEYQDCNQLQESMFRLISKKINEKDCNMFMVGDIKQSIYRFRQADPTIFLEKSNTYSKTGDIQRKITLNKNFRSNSIVLNAVNDIFSAIMNPVTGDITYSDDEKLYYRTETVPDDEPKCELLLIDKEDTIEDIENADSHEIEARVVANRILKLIAQGYDYKDIAILSRNPKNAVGAFENEFKNRLIPYYIDYETGFFDGLEIRLFLSLIKITDNPMQDIPLTGVLRSKLFKFTDDELAMIRKCSKGLFYNALLKCSTSDTPLGKKCADFLNRLSLWQDAAIYMPVDEFLIYLANDTALYSYASLLPGGNQRKANIDLLIQQARSLMKSGFKGLYPFINHIDKIKNSGQSGGAKILSQNSDVVRIMSIHKSKGLEFPIVFLIDCERGFVKEDLKSNLFIDKDLGFCIKFLDSQKHIKYPLISNIAGTLEFTRKLISEEMRLLYVALTRAKTKFICCGRISKATEIADMLKTGTYKHQDKHYIHELFYSNKYFDWILPFVSDKWEIQAANKSDFDVNSHITEIMLPEYEECAEKIKNILEYTYPYEKATGLATKYSVSELKKKTEYDDISSAKLYESLTKTTPSFVRPAECEISATQAGTVNHLVLSKIDYRPMSETEIYEFAKMLVKQGFLTKEELDCVDCTGLCEFLSSSLAKRMSSSKRMFREFPFNMNMDTCDFGEVAGETVLVQGVIDCMFEEDDRIVVVDFKTDKYLSEKSRIQYSKQLDIYARAAKLITGKEICEKYLYMISKNQVIPFE